MITKRGEYSFYDWCIDNHREDLIKRWDYDLNNKSPQEISFKSNLKYWFKCPRGIHESQLHDIQYISSGRTKNIWCKKCRSFAQHVIDDYGEEYFNKIWNKNNILDPWEIAYKSTKSAIFNCINDSGHVYEMSFQNFSKGQGCPYCSHRKLNIESSLGHLYPEVLEIWSDKNKKSPYDYFPHSSSYAWFKCMDGKHEDYCRKIYTSTNLNFRCPQCSVEYIVRPAGENAYNWRGGTTPENKMARLNSDYKKWRDFIFKRDNYTCQCCGMRGDKLNAHHILNFSDHEDLRYDTKNGITLCKNCHDVTISGSFHNNYGTIKNTSQQLEEYINNRRKDLGIEEKFSVKEYLNGKILKPIKK